MGIPNVVVNVIDGNLGIQPGSNERVVLIMGPCTLGIPNTLGSAGDSSTISTNYGLGQLVEAANYVLSIGGGPVMLMPMAFSNAGGKSSVTHTGTGAMTCTVSFAPHVSITITCTTSGSIGGVGGAAFTFQRGSGTVSAPVVSDPTWATSGYLVPGTFCTVVFTTGAYTTADIYTISTAGAVTHTAGTGPAVPTISASPIDNYDVLVTVTTAGALATSQFTYSLDNGCTQLNNAGVTSANITTAGSGVYVIPNTGVVMTFSGTAVAGDTYVFTTCGPSANNTDLSNALTQLETTYLSQATYSLALVLGMPASASAWATEAATLQTAATTLFNSGVYMRFLNEVPTVGSITASGGAVVVDSADTDSVLIAQMASVSANRTFAGAGDCLLTSGVTGLTLRRSAAWTEAARMASIEASEDVGAVELGGLTGVVYIFRDEAATPGLDAVGFNVMRKWLGTPGFYFTGGHSATLTTSDFFPATNCRVMDRLCGVSRQAALPLVLSKIPTTTRNGLVGVITESKAQFIEGKLDSAISTAMVLTSPADLVAGSATVNRTHNILSDGNLIISVAGQPFGYARTITENIGFAVSA